MKKEINKILFISFFINNSISSSQKSYKKKIIFFLQNNKKKLTIGSLLSGAAIYYYFKNQNKQDLKTFTDILKQYYEGFTIVKAKEKNLNTVNFDEIIKEGKKYLDFKTYQTKYNELSIYYIDDLTGEFNKENFLKTYPQYKEYFELENEYNKLTIPLKQDCGFITIAQAQYIKNFETYKKISTKEAVKTIIEGSSFLDPKKNGGPREGQTDFNELIDNDKDIDSTQIGKGIIPIHGYNKEYIEKIKNRFVNQLEENYTAALLVSCGSNLKFENKQDDQLDEVWKNIQHQQYLIGCGHWSTLIKNNNKLFIVQTVQVNKEQKILFTDYMKQTMSGNNIKKVVSIIPLNNENLSKISNHNFLGKSQN
jgi:hypothetical protein